MQNKNIVNIVNFVRGEDNRISAEELFSTVEKQIELFKQYPLPNSFLLQYDAFQKPEYQTLFKENANDYTEIGVWFEMAQELVERVGIKWRGREGFKWDWFVNPDMLIAYTLDERKLLIDELMTRFKSIFGFYPKTVGSWILDSFSMDYMQSNYGVEAFLICKEQFGTDGYTLWGGYYNGAYYPSKKNPLVPATTEENQISAPVIRMLGPDPIYQYDCGLNEQFDPCDWQQVITIEPTAPIASNEKWVDWYLNTTFFNESLNMAYTQLGQENSFGWDNFGTTLTMHIKKIDELYKNGKVAVQKVCDTGAQFKAEFSQTPATAITALTDWQNCGKQSVWFNCKNYRANMFTENGGLLLRDLFLFNENYPEKYLTDIETTNRSLHDTFPICDGFRFSGNGKRAGLHIVNTDGEKLSAKILNAQNSGKNALRLSLEIENIPAFAEFTENEIKFSLNQKNAQLRYVFNTMPDTEIVSIKPQKVTFSHSGFTYGFTTDGTLSPTSDGFTLSPVATTVTLTLFCD